MEWEMHSMQGSEWMVDYGHCFPSMGVCPCATFPLSGTVRIDANCVEFLPDVLPDILPGYTFLRGHAVEYEAAEFKWEQLPVSARWLWSVTHICTDSAWDAVPLSTDSRSAVEFGVDVSVWKSRAMAELPSFYRTIGNAGVISSDIHHAARVCLSIIDRDRIFIRELPGCVRK